MTTPQNTSSTRTLIQVLVHNSDLRIETEILKSKIHDIKIEKQTFLTEIKKLNEDLKIKEDQLNTHIGDKRLLQEKCKTLESDNLRLKSEIMKEAQANINIENNLKNKEEELRSLQQKTTKSNTNLSPYESSEAILKVIDMHDNLQRLNDEKIKLTEALTKEITENRCNYEEELEKCTIEYKKREKYLEKLGIMGINNTFPMMVDHFKSLRRENTTKQKEILEKIGNPFDEEDKLDIMQRYMSKQSTDFKSYIDGQEKILNDLKQVSFLSDFKNEEERFKDLIKTCKDEICHFDKLFRARKPSSSNTSHSSDDADKIAILMKKFPESDTVEDDLRIIKSFLSINFNVEEVKDMVRLGLSKSEIHPRFVKVILKDQETVKRVLEENNKKRTGVVIVKYENNYKRKQLEQANLI